MIQRGRDVTATDTEAIGQPAMPIPTKQPTETSHMNARTARLVRDSVSTFTSSIPDRMFCPNAL